MPAPHAAKMSVAGYPECVVPHPAAATSATGTTYVIDGAVGAEVGGAGFVVGGVTPVVREASSNPTVVDVSAVIAGVALAVGAVSASQLPDGAVVPALSVAHPAARASTAVSSAAARLRGVDIIGWRASLARHSLPSRQVRGAA